MEPEEAYKKIKEIYKQAQVEIDTLASQHKKSVEEILHESDQRKLEDVRKRIQNL